MGALRGQIRRCALLGILLLAAALRLVFCDWDGGIAAHPDERYLLGVAQGLNRLGNPCVTQPDFPYGHVPVYLARLLVAVAPAADPLYAARLLSGLIGVVLVALTMACGQAVAGDAGAVVAGLVAAGAPFLIQQGHYYTTDPLGAAFATVAILVAMRRRWIAGGVAAGLAVACKLSMIWVLVPMLAGALGVLERRRCAVQDSCLWGRTAHVRAAIGLMGGAGAAFALSSPWTLLTPVACWRGPLIQIGMVAGRYDFPYVRQYAGTLPWVYPAVQSALWGIGPLAMVATFVGLVRSARQWGQRRYAERLVWLWCVGGYLVFCGTAVKFPRYTLPLYPLWIGWAAAGSLGLRGSRDVVHAGYRGRAVASALMVMTTLALGLAQVTSYARPHPWIEASRWIYAHLPPDAVIAVEAWDHPLPVPLAEGNAERYVQIELPVFDEDAPVKLAVLDRALEEADLIVLASHRSYGALSRQPERYAATLAWYARLLEGRDALVFGRCPRLAGIALSDDPLIDAGLPAVNALAERCGAVSAVRLPRLDESFRVYEHPMVLLLPRAAP